ncbi:glutathione S-transferase family protein [Undibacterium cyanobacteriorum]|uniref:Glutathione S-transferase family protein n=2 Tax=Undibacterium cyanobacteriorum TaxID=3073561 RepID=A0ABY9RFQ3_9BURK|nr:glutathione S-transferase family protein [Undibacterium sp. 20NA77.5]WMW79678.1 glutathione S-transferase family protein [Undibacterium sp. 20NA77.5]
MNCVLYSGTKNASSWAMRAWLALREAGIEFEERVVDIRRPQRFKNLEKVARFSPPGAVPVLVVDHQVIFDSLAIMEFANECADGALLPREMMLRARARSLMAWQHSGLSNICPRISFESAFYPDKRELSEAEQTQVSFLFGVWENQLQQSQGSFLCGALSLADLNFVPSLIRILRHHDNVEMFPLVAAWSDRLLRRESVQEWMREAERLPHVWYDDYLLL